MIIYMVQTLQLIYNTQPGHFRPLMDTLEEVKKGELQYFRMKSD